MAWHGALNGVWVHHVLGGSFATIVVPFHLSIVGRSAFFLKSASEVHSLIQKLLGVCKLSWNPTQTPSTSWTPNGSGNTGVFSWIGRRG